MSKAAVGVVFAWFVAAFRQHHQVHGASGRPVRVHQRTSQLLGRGAFHQGVLSQLHHAGAQHGGLGVVLAQGVQHGDRQCFRDIKRIEP